MDDRAVFTFRASRSLMARVDARCREGEWASAETRGGTHGGRDSGRSAVILCLLEAFAEGRVIVLPRAASAAFPAGEVLPGSSPACPALISRSEP